MKNLQSIRRRHIIILVALLILTGYVAVLVRWWIPWYTISPSEHIVRQAESDLAVARERWQSHQPLNYRFSYAEQNLYYNVCATTYVVQENTFTIERSSCASPTYPHLNIPTLFDAIEQTLTERKCGPNGCDCDGHIYVDVNYDPHYGYPTDATIKTTNISALPPSQSNPLSLFGRGPAYIFGCTLIGFRSSSSYQITKFEVLP